MNRFKENHPLTKENLNNLKLDFVDYIFYTEIYLSQFSDDEEYLNDIEDTKKALLNSIHMLMDLINDKVDDEDLINYIDYVTNTYGVLKSNDFSQKICSGEDYEIWVESFIALAETTYEELSFEDTITN